MPLMLVFPNPSRNLAIPRSTSLYPTIPRRGDPCGHPLRQSPSPMSFQFPRETSSPTPPLFPFPFRCSREGGNLSRLSTSPRRGGPCGRPLRHSTPPHAPTPLPPPLFPFPFRCSREGGNPSRLSTSPRRGDPCGHPLRQSTSPHVPTPPLLPFFPLPLRCSREGGNPSPPSYPHLSFSRRARPRVDVGGYPSPGPTVGAVREPPIPLSPHSPLSTFPRRGGPWSLFHKSNLSENWGFWIPAFAGMTDLVNILDAIARKAV